jgi:hypothetical protein
MKTARLLEFIERGKRAVLRAQREYQQREGVIRHARVPLDDEPSREETPKLDIERFEMVKGAR